MSGRDCIVTRVESALERARYRGEKVRALCLSEADRKAWNKARSKEWGSEVVSLSYCDIPIRHGERSAVYTDVGVAIYVPKRLSAKVAA